VKADHALGSEGADQITVIIFGVRPVAKVPQFPFGPPLGLVQGEEILKRGGELGGLGHDFGKRPGVPGELRHGAVEIARCCFPIVFHIR